MCVTHGLAAVEVAQDIMFRRAGCSCCRRQLMNLRVLVASVSFFVLLWLLMTNRFGWQVLTGAFQPSVITLTSSPAMLTTSLLQLIHPFSCGTALQASTIAIIALGGRVPQILMNIRRGNSGELSIITTGLNVIGCAIRVFTTIVLTQVLCSPHHFC